MAVSLKLAPTRSLTEVRPLLLLGLHVAQAEASRPETSSRADRPGPNVPASSWRSSWKGRCPGGSARPSSRRTQPSASATDNT